ncbi:MAG: ROK family protein [Hyphomicrobiaceae bacterium]
MTQKDPLRIGIDLGGTKIEGVVLTSDGQEAARKRVAAPKGDYDQTLAAVRDLVLELERDAGGTGRVGVGMPGSISPATGLVQNGNSTWLNGRRLSQDLEAALARPIRCANDANCFAMSEAVDGAGAGKRIVFGVILGTGCGGGLVIDGRIVDGPRGIGGEWGHNPLPWPAPAELPGPECWCGRPGCMETWVSGTGLALDHARISGEAIAGEEVAARATAGDEAALATLARHADRLARGLSHIVNLIDPDLIVLGGGLSKLPHLYAEVPRLMERWVFSDTPFISISPPRWGDASGVRGAAWLWNDP